MFSPAGKTALLLASLHYRVLHSLVDDDQRCILGPQAAQDIAQSFAPNKTHTSFLQVSRIGHRGEAHVQNQD